MINGLNFVVGVSQIALLHQLSKDSDTLTCLKKKLYSNVHFENTFLFVLFRYFLSSYLIFLFFDTSFFQFLLSNVSFKKLQKSDQIFVKKSIYLNKVLYYFFVRNSLYFWCSSSAQWSLNFFFFKELIYYILFCHKTGKCLYSNSLVTFIKYCDIFSRKDF